MRKNSHNGVVPKGSLYIPRKVGAINTVKSCKIKTLGHFPWQTWAIKQTLKNCIWGPEDFSGLKINFRKNYSKIVN